MTVFRLEVNGEARSADVEGDKPLLWVLREDLGCTGTKYGCGIAMCGACTVLIEDVHEPPRPVRSCVLRVRDVKDSKIKTIEGLSKPWEKAVQQAWIDEEVPQCGYCQSGQIMTTVALIDGLQRQSKAVSDDDINAALAGNLCRCGTYVRIRAAVKKAWDEIRRSGSWP